MLTFNDFSGSPFQIGLSLGKFGAPAVHDYLTASSTWHKIMQWRGSDHSLAMQQLVQHHHPHIWDELQGLAKGLELPAEDIFLWNCRGDLCDLIPDGCTTILQLTPDGPRITHNADGDPGLAAYCGIAEFIVDRMPAFATFIYPGSLPGHTFAVTEHGLALAADSLRSPATAPGLPRMVLTRALLTMPDIGSAIDLLRTSPRAGGFHLGLAQRGSGATLLSIEFNATDLSILPVKTASLHTNHMVHETMRGLPQTITESSRQRQQDGFAMLQDSNNTPDALHILADQSSQRYPIYRNAPDDSDNENTLAIADIHIGADHVSWDIYEQPDSPVRFRMRDAKHI